MIQSDKFDSSKMDIKKIANSTLTFTINRLVEIFSIIISLFGFLLLIALLSYSPNDPNFIFPENTDIKNILGFRGSYISDLFFQSIGLISYLLAFTFIFTGISLFKLKGFFLIIKNIFFSLPFCLLGTVFFNHFYNDTFKLYVNVNGGFVGNYINKGLINDLLSSYEHFHITY